MTGSVLLSVLLAVSVDDPCRQTKIDVQFRPYLYFSGGYHYRVYPITRLTVENQLPEDLSLSLETRRGKQRFEKPLARLPANAGVDLVWKNRWQRSSAVTVITRNKNGRVVAKKEVFVYSDRDSQTFFLVR